MNLDVRTLAMMALAAGTSLATYAGPTEKAVEGNAEAKAPDPLTYAPCMVDVDGEEVCTKSLTWSELSDDEKATLTAAIEKKRKAETAADVQANVGISAPSTPRPFWISAHIARNDNAVRAVWVTATIPINATVTKSTADPEHGFENDPDTLTYATGMDDRETCTEKLTAP